jgi:hypothetical protein
VSSLHSDMHEIKSLLKLLIKENVDDNWKSYPRRTCITV